MGRTVNRRDRLEPRCSDLAGSWQLESTPLGFPPVAWGAPRLASAARQSTLRGDPGSPPVSSASDSLSRSFGKHPSMSNDLARFFSFAGVPAEAQQKAVDVCAAAGLEAVVEFADADVALIEGLDSLHPRLVHGIKQLRALAVKILARRRSTIVSHALSTASRSAGDEGAQSALKRRALGPFEARRAVEYVTAASEQLSQRPVVGSVPSVGPKKAAVSLAAAVMSASDAAEWVEGARVASLLGSAVHSHKETASVLRTWLQFVKAVQATIALPPELNLLIAWSQLFKTTKVYTNYMAKVKLACEVAQLDVTVFQHPSIGRAKRALGKREKPPREKRFISKQLVSQLVSSARQLGDGRFALLCIVSYAFMLRVPSEALPMRLGHDGNQAQASGQQSVLYFENDEAGLQLVRRKNRRFGSVLRRKCSCSSCAATCPVCTLRVACADMVVGQPLFPKRTGTSVNKQLRALLQALGVQDADSYRAHDFRRGHAEDLRLAGVSLAEIMARGEWDSPAVFTYVDISKLEADTVLAAVLDEESDED